jgi:hypothetical protein
MLFRDEHGLSGGYAAGGALRPRHATIRLRRVTVTQTLDGTVGSRTSHGDEVVRLPPALLARVNAHA